jgi:hypothetical protein
VTWVTNFRPGYPEILLDRVPNPGYTQVMETLTTTLTALETLPTIGTATVVRNTPVTHVRTGSKLQATRPNTDWSDMCQGGYQMAQLVGTVAVVVKVANRRGGFAKAAAQLAKAVKAEQARQAA